MMVDKWSPHYPEWLFTDRDSEKERRNLRMKWNERKGSEGNERKGWEGNERKGWEGREPTFTAIPHSLCRTLVTAFRTIPQVRNM